MVFGLIVTIFLQLEQCISCRLPLIIHCQILWAPWCFLFYFSIFFDLLKKNLKTSLIPWRFFNKYISIYLLKQLSHPRVCNCGAFVCVREWKRVCVCVWVKVVPSSFLFILPPFLLDREWAIPYPFSLPFSIISCLLTPPSFLSLFLFPISESVIQTAKF